MHHPRRAYSIGYGTIGFFFTNSALLDLLTYLAVHLRGRREYEVTWFLQLRTDGDRFDPPNSLEL